MLSQCRRVSRAIENTRRKTSHKYACRERSNFLRTSERERERRQVKCSSGSPRKSVNVGKVRVEGRPNLRVRGRVMARVCMG